MRKVILSMYLSLDGIVENPTWSMPFWNDDLEKYAREQLFASDALLLGRVTYEAFAATWPHMTDEHGFADRINTMPKYVASRTLTELSWNASLLKGHVAGAVTQLKQQAGQNLLIYGGADFVETLRQHNLIDEYRLWVHPVLVGKGQRCFKENITEMTLKLAETKVFSSGVVILNYHPV